MFDNCRATTLNTVCTYNTKERMGLNFNLRIVLFYNIIIKYEWNEFCLEKRFLRGI